MRQGYLLIETHPDHPGRIHIRGVDHLEAIPPDAIPPDAIRPGPTRAEPVREPRIRYAARFGDLDVALMHAHTVLRRGLIDIDAHLYRADPVTAVAAVDAIELNHRRVYLDPCLAADPGLEAEIARHHRVHRRIDRIWNGVGIAALLLLLAKLLLGI